jgi:hypothetical protein
MEQIVYRSDAYDYIEKNQISNFYLFDTVTPLKSRHFQNTQFTCLI